MAILCRRHQWGAALIVCIVDVCAPGQKTPHFMGPVIRARAVQGRAHRSHAPPTLTATGLSTRHSSQIVPPPAPFASSYLQSAEQRQPVLPVDLFREPSLARLEIDACHHVKDKVATSHLSSATILLRPRRECFPMPCRRRWYRW